MKNISKQITLFMIATVVTFLGITYTLFKGTQATDVIELPANSAFNDINFYKCVVYSYSEENDTDYDYTVNLNDEQLATITDLSCDYGYSYGCTTGDCKLTVSEKVTNVVGIEKLTNLQFLSIISNDLTALNIENNTKLETLIASRNKISTIDLDNNLMLETIELSDNLLTNIDISRQTELKYLAIGSNLLTSIDVSKNELLEELYVGYDYFDKKGNGIGYSKEKNQITTLDVSNNTYLKVLNAVDNNLDTLNIENNELLTILNVSKNNLKEVNVSKHSGLKRLYAHSNNLTSIDISNNSQLEVLSVANNNLIDLDVSNNTLLSILSIGKWCRGNNGSSICGGNEITKLDLTNNSKLTELYIDSNPFVSDVGLYVGTSSLDFNVIKMSDEFNYTLNELSSVDEKILVSETNISVDDTGVYEVSATYSHNVGDSYVDYSGVLKIHVIEATSEKYKINEDLSYIYTKTDVDHNTILNNISINEGTKEIVDNKLVIKYAGEIIKKFDLVNVSSDYYDLSNDYIFVGANVLNENNFDIINAKILVGDNKLLVKYNDDILDEFKLFSINFGSYEVLNKIVILSEEISYEAFTSVITISDGITYKIFNDDSEVTVGNVEDGMILKVYYNDLEIYEYTISNSNEYIRIDDNLKLDEINMIISNIDVGTTVDKLKNKINTSGEVSILDKNSNVIEDVASKIKTGDKIKIKLSSQEFVYAISVTGDVTGDGDITEEDIKKISKHLLNNKEIVGEEYLLAGDYDRNNTIDINDIVKLSKYINSNG